MKLLAASLAACSLMGSSALAQYTVTLELNNGLPPSSETLPAGHARSDSNPQTSFNGATSLTTVGGSAYSGSVGAYAIAEVTTRGTGFGLASAQGSATAVARSTQLVMTSGAATVNTPLALDFSGFTSGVFSLGPSPFSGGGSASVSLSVRVASADNLTTYYSGSGEYSSRWSGSGEPSAPEASGLLASFTGAPALVTTGSFSVPANVPLLLEISLYAGANFSAYNDVNATLTSSFGHTLSLTTAGPVFPGLLPGESANAPDFNLAGNLYTAVPEPSAWALAAGVLALGLAVWHRRR